MACPRCGSTLAASCQCSLESSDCIDVTGAGTPSDPFIPSLIIDPDADNIAECSASGLLVVPSPVLGFSGQIIVEQTGMTDPTDVVGSSVPVVLPANHYISLKFYIGGFRSTVSGDSWSAQIKEGLSVLQERFIYIAAVSPRAFGGGATEIILENPTAGAHTYKATMDREVGSGTGSLIANGTNPMWFLVTDFGPT